MNTENALQWLGIVFLVCMLFLIMQFALSDKPVVRYNLGASTGTLYINADIDNATDTNIPLDRSVTYERAVAIVDSLNAELVRHPRLR